jgi:hypothetical protein
MLFKPGTNQEKLALTFTQWQMAKNQIELKGQTCENAFGNQRFGQYFLNTCLNTGESWPEVFYEPSTDVAYQKISQYLNEHASVYEKV